MALWFLFCSIAHNVFVPFFGMFSLINLNYLNIVIICFCFVKKDKNIRRPCCRRKRQGACRPGQQQEQQKASPSFLESFGYGHILQEGHSVFKSLFKSEFFTCCFKELPPSLLGTSFNGLLEMFFLFPNWGSGASCLLVFCQLLLNSEDDKSCIIHLTPPATNKFYRAWRSPNPEKSADA